jgi:hypothetical protein
MRGGALRGGKRRGAGSLSHIAYFSGGHIAYF